MSHVVFVVPYAMDATLRFVRAAASLRGEGLRLGIISQQSADRFPQDLRNQFDAFEQVRNALNPDELTSGVRTLARSFGGRVDRLIGILEPLQESLAQTRENLGLDGMRPEAARNFRDKAHMKDMLRTSGLPCARHQLATSAQEAVAFGRSSGYPLVVKPPAGAGAKNTFRVESEEELEGYLRSMPPRPGTPVLLEEFLSGTEYSFDSVTLGGRHLMHSISEYSPTPLEVMSTPWIQWNVLLPKDISGPEFAAIREAGPRSLDVLGMDTGITHMEWFQRGDGTVAISEVAARPPGAQITSLIGYAHDIDLYQEWVRIVGLDRFQVPARRWAVGAAYFRGQGDGRVAAIHGIEEAQKELGELVIEATLPHKGQPKASSYEGEGFAILRHEDTEVVREGLKRLVTLMRVEMA
ncbi:MAG: ATP-grasp domain-containing protein [bacterium]|nr:ATP-grasp domain-containing protein [bacterium]